ncbi:MAG: hypothetical protein KKC46_01915 [Proteobacteria bacterium]|nr:hypothetical protein [Pseudomonadota bacterium]
MKKIDKSSWPVLFVTDQINQKNDESAWLKELQEQLTREQDCSYILSTSFGDAHDIVFSREDLGAIVLDYNLADAGRLHRKNYCKGIAGNNVLLSGILIDFIRTRNQSIPILLLVNRGSIEEIPESILAGINGTIWKLTDTVEFLSGRIERHVTEYIKSVLPSFFGTMIEYVNEYKYAWHTPGHMGGQGFLRSPSGTAFHKFFGEDVLRADLSISVPELGSLLDHSGVTGEAEQFSAKVFGADKCYYVLNGTSTANQIIWRSQISPGQASLVDRNCHKSLNYAMIITEAKPEYMCPVRNGMGIIGPVDFTKIKPKEYNMSALTNSTYDGVCYNIEYVMKKLNQVKVHHFDEAWYAYAKFHPLYQNHYGMALAPNDRLVFCSQSTHKLLTAFSQASMIHVRLTEDILKSPEKTEMFQTLFNESYMMHGSTSPQYNMVASLEVASKMMHDNGPVLFNDIITEAIELRKKTAQIQKDYLVNNDWFFGMWQPDTICETPLEELISNQDYWVIKHGDAWHGFDVAEDYVMLDPIKLTFTCPGIDVNGNYQKMGIPASIVTNYLIDKGIVCEKSDYYSFLLLNSPGTTRGKQGTLVAELLKFKELYDLNILLGQVFPELVKQYPDKYKNIGLKDHCQMMHEYIQKNNILKLMDDAFKNIPLQKMVPSDAYRQVVCNKVEFVELRNIQPEQSRIQGVMVVPYPPGIPVIMGGEVYDSDSDPILSYLLARQDFENTFPGYESDIHGIERTEVDLEGKTYFKTLLIKE